MLFSCVHPNKMMPKASLVRAWDLQTLREKHQVPHTGEVHCLAVPRASTLVCWGSGSQLVTWDTRTREYNVRGVGARVTTTSISSDGVTLATGTQDGRVLIWDTRTTKKNKLEIGEFQL